VSATEGRATGAVERREGGVRPAPRPAGRGEIPPAHPVTVQLAEHRVRLGAAVLSAPRVEPDWVLPGLPRRDVGMIAAPGGTGKTRLGLQMAMGVALGTGWPWHGWARPPGRVLYLAAEEHADTLVDRLRAIAQATAMTAPDMDILDERLDLHSMVALPGACLSSMGTEGPLTVALLGLPSRRYRLIVIDPLASFAGVDAENDNAAATRLVKYLRAVGGSTGAAVVVVHHVAKAAILNGQTHLAVSARGAVGLTDGVRWQAQLTRPAEGQAGPTDDPGTWRQLTVAKANHVRDGQTAWLRFGPDGVLWAAERSPCPDRPDQTKARQGRESRRW